MDILQNISIIKNFMGNAGRTTCNDYLYMALNESIPELEKRIPKKPIFKYGKSGSLVDYADGSGEYKVETWAEWVCPECGWFVGEQYIPRRHNQRKCNFCSRCGQAIDWNVKSTE